MKTYYYCTCGHSLPHHHRMRLSALLCAWLNRKTDALPKATPHGSGAGYTLNFDRWEGAPPSP